jgi:regulatory protein YycI of two-component signal transduction system YycFG
MRFRWGQALYVFLFLWLLILLYLIFPMWKSSENEEKLVRAQNEILRLNAENEKLRGLLKNVEEQLDNLRKVHKNPKTSLDVEKEEEKAEKLRDEVSTIVDGPSKRYELQRRKIRRDVNEFWCRRHKNVSLFVVIDGTDERARAFVPSEHFQTSVIFVVQSQKR